MIHSQMTPKGPIQDPGYATDKAPDKALLVLANKEQTLALLEKKKKTQKQAKALGIKQQQQHRLQRQQNSSSIIRF